MACFFVEPLEIAPGDSIRSVSDVQLKFLSRMCEDILMGKQTVVHQLHNHTIQNISYNFAYTKKQKLLRRYHW